MFFSVITKKLKWGILTKNLITFKLWDKVKMKNFNIMGVHWKIQFLRGGPEKPIYRGNFPQKNREGRGGGWWKRGGGVFGGRELIPQCTLCGSRVYFVFLFNEIILRLSMVQNISRRILTFIKTSCCYYF